MIETKRLKIRYPKMKDLKDVYEFSKSKDVGPNAGWLEHKSIKDTKVVLKYNISKKDVYAIEYKENSKVIGLVSLIKMSYFEDEYELGYVLNKDYWNKGIMSEAINIFIDYAFNTLNIKKIITGHSPDNIASKKIIINNGFKFKYINNKPMYENKNIKEVYMYELLNSKEKDDEI